MELHELRVLVEQDSQIDDTQLDTESRSDCLLFTTNILTFTTMRNFVTKKPTNEYNRLYRLKWEYYTGKIDQETLDKKGWEPFQHNILKQRHSYLYE